MTVRRIALIALTFGASMRPLVPAPLFAQAATIAQLQSGQELIFRGHFGAAQVYFSDLSRQYAADPAGPTLEASALIWWGEARGELSFLAGEIDSLIGLALARAEVMRDSGADGGTRFTGHYWLGIAHGYRARQADAAGNAWRAVREARAMRTSLEQALGMDSSCVDCLSGLGVYDYGLARAGALARLAARIIGLGGGDAQRGLLRLRRAAKEGMLTQIESRWVLATVLLQEGERDQGLREEGLGRLAELVAQFPENPVFRRALDAASPP